MALATAQAATANPDAPVTWDTLAPAITSNNALLQEESFEELTASFVSRYGASVVESLDTEIWKDTSVAQSHINTTTTIDGYVLPLASDGVRVTEFLLVPWVGACIHTPAPPPNQTIHVSYPEGLALKKPFEPVRLRGILTKQPAYHPLFLVDGSRAVPTAYTLREATEFGQTSTITAASASLVPAVTRAQIWVNELFTSSMAGLSSGGFSTSLLWALFLSFGYGALHTLGPGHGKTVVASYFVGTGGSFRRGVAMGVRIAVIHVFSAVVVVFLFDLTMRQVTGAPASDYRAVRLASYGLIILIGSVMLWQAMSALRAHRKRVAQASHDHGHSHHDHDHHHHHDDHHHSGCSACAAAQAPKGSGWIAASVGIVPCTGALLVMLFGLANDLIWPAILMVVFISAGMALAMSAIGVAALWGRQLAERNLATDPQRRARFELGARFAGAACVFAVGLVLFSVTWTTHSTLSFPQGNMAQSGDGTDSFGG
ncbi:MAG: DUF3299 domain-containing protein [Shimia sp.]|nr:DUF3299 domain-containing protein [Shimia sp.]